MDHEAGALTLQLDGLFDGFEPFHSLHLYTEDTVLDVSRSPNSIGVVERTHEDVDNHAPSPQSDYPGLEIAKARGVSASAFQTFLRDGIPPKDTVLIRWQGFVPVELTLVSNVRLIDRALLTGDVVKRNAQSTVSGTVTRVHVTCAMIHTYYQGLVANAPNVPAVHVLQNIPAIELDFSEKYVNPMIVIYADWVGRIEFVEQEVAIRLRNNSVVVVEDPEELETASGIEGGVAVGEIVKTKKGNLRRGRWVFGAFDANVEPVGQVVGCRPTSLEVTWLAPRPGTSREQPPELLDRDTLDQNEVKVYDALLPDKDSTAYCTPSYGPGDFVKFRDSSAAAMQYKDRGMLVKIPRTDTLGYDINTFCIMATHTRVDVRWQDGTESSQDATSLVPDPNIDDDDEVWPGEIVLSRQAKEGDDEPWSFKPARVGVIQTVNSADRIAKVRWWQESTVQYYNEASMADLPHGEPGLMPDPVLESLSHKVEEVSLYDIRPAVGLNKRLGDLCAILPEASTARRPVKDGTDSIDWFGEVVAMGLDGIIKFRLSLAEQVCDIEVKPQDLLLVLGNDMEDDVDGAGSVGSDDAYTASEESRDIDDIMRDGRFDDLSDMTVEEEFHETMEYQGNGGERLGGDGGDTAWETESSSDDGDADTPMTDVKPTPRLQPIPSQPGSVTSIEALEQSFTLVGDGTRTEPAMHSLSNSNNDPRQQSFNIRTSSLGITSHSNAPQGFAILDGSAPASHHYHDTPQSTSNTNLRRITKEHKILRKDGALPEGVFVRTWESRLDLLRILFIGPLDTPYMFAPFIMDIHLAEDFPRNPPQVFFHSWTNGSGPVNPNLYEDGKVCLSLLGTWSGEATESWDPEKSTILQILVSLLGLVLVREPYFNEAGYEVRIGSEDAKIPSALYSERTYLRSRYFIQHALQHPVEGFVEEIRWLYTCNSDGGPHLLTRATDAAKLAIETSESEEGKRATERDGFTILSAGAILKLRRQIVELEAAAKDLMY